MRAPPLRNRIDAETLRELYWEHGLSTKEIAERYGSYSSNIIVLMHKYGIARRSQGAGKRS
jgi:hypothetical protein